MSAYFNQGFTVREPAWHGLGTVFDDYPGREEAMVAAGHNFEVIERGLFLAPTELPEGGDVTLKSAEGFKALARGDQPDTVFTVVKNSYEIIQPTEMWDVVDALCEQPNMKYETGGILKDGAIMWVMAYLDEPVQVPGDDSPIYPWVCVSTAHDGSAAMVARATSIRVVCWNTFSAAEAESARSKREFTFRHTKNVATRIEDAKLALKGIRSEHDAFIEIAEELAAMPVSAKGVEFFIGQFIPTPPEALISDRVVKNIEAARNVVRQIIASPTIGNGEGVRNAWDLLNVGGEYLDHLRGFRSRDTLFGRQLLRAEPLKAKLVPLVKEAATL